MTLDSNSIYVAVLIVTALAGIEMIKLVTRHFFQKINRDDYVTRTICEEQRSNCGKNRERDNSDTLSDIQCLKVAIEKDFREIRRDIKSIKRGMVVIASSGNVPPDKLATLTSDMMGGNDE